MPHVRKALGSSAPMAPPLPSTSSCYSSASVWKRLKETGRNPQWRQSHAETFHTPPLLVWSQESMMECRDLKSVNGTKMVDGMVMWGWGGKHAHHHYPCGKIEGPFCGCGLYRTQRFTHMHALMQKLISRGFSTQYIVKAPEKLHKCQAEKYAVCGRSPACGRFRRSIKEISLHFAWNASSIKIFFRTRVVTFTYVSLKVWTWDFPEGLLQVIRNDWWPKFEASWQHGSIWGSEMTWHRRGLRQTGFDLF